MDISIKTMRNNIYALGVNCSQAPNVYYLSAIGEDNINVCIYATREQFQEMFKEFNRILEIEKR